MAGVYVVLAIGMVIAFLTLVAEIYWKRRGGNKIIARVRRYANDFFFQSDNLSCFNSLINDSFLLGIQMLSYYKTYHSTPR